MSDEFQEEYDRAKRLILDSHRRFLDGEKDGVRLNLQGEDLRRSRFGEANLCQARFDGAILDRAEFSDCNFHLARFVGARLTKVIMTRAVFRPTRRQP